MQLGAARLRLELDRIPLWAGNHVAVKQIIEYFARYLYLPRLHDEQVLLNAIADGVRSLMWRTETFAYAEAWDAQQGRYLGLRAGEPVRIVADESAVLVKSEIAAAQLDEQTRAAAVGGVTGAGEGQALKGDRASGRDFDGSTPSQPEAGRISAPQGARRFHGAVKIDPQRVVRDAERIASEVVQHLTCLVGAKVEITLEIRAELPQGVSEKTIRDVSENCRTLKFESQGFESE